jgi:hypothetical protein
LSGQIGNKKHCLDRTNFQTKNGNTLLDLIANSEEKSNDTSANLIIFYAEIGGLRYDFQSLYNSILVVIL